MVLLMYSAPSDRSQYWRSKRSKSNKKLEIWGRPQRKAVRRRKSDCWDNFGWFKFRWQQRHLANQAGKLSEIAPKFHLGGSTWAPITFLFVDQSSPSFFAQRGRGCSWSTFRFSICGSVPEIFAIKLESCQKSRCILDVSCPPKFYGSGLPQK